MFAFRYKIKINIYAASGFGNNNKFCQVKHENFQRFQKLEDYKSHNLYDGITFLTLYLMERDI